MPRKAKDESEQTPVAKTKTATTKKAAVGIDRVPKKTKTTLKAKAEKAVEESVVAESKPTPAKEKTAKKPRAAASIGTFNLKGKDAELLTKYQRNQADTGSTEVQVTLFTAKINSLAKHLKKHAKDSDSKRGLLIMVGKRRRLLNYLLKHSPEQYQKLIADLKLRK